MTGLEIYKLLPKTNCKKCGFPTCLAFAMALAAKKTSLEKCPDVTEDAKQQLAAASEPPIRTIVFEDNKRQIKLGGETVLFRHEKTFWNPCGLGVYLSDTMPQEVIQKILVDFSKLNFERFGEKVRSEFLYIRNDSDNLNQFSSLVKECVLLDAFIIINSKKIDFLKSVIQLFPTKKFIISGADETNFLEFVELAKSTQSPLSVEVDSLEKFIPVSEAIAKSNFKDLIIELKSVSVTETLDNLTQIRRLALKKNIRALGCPVIVFTKGSGVFEEVAEAAQYIEKYASIVIAKTSEVSAHLALVTLRQNIYTDPQKPVAVEPKIYRFGNVTENSPVLLTTNFSLTYYSVAPEIENSKVPAYLLVIDTEGMSVLTAWAADKLTPEKIDAAMKKENLKDIVRHRKIILPGYVAILSGKLADVTGWEVLVGPKEASGIPKFLKSLNLS